MKWPIIEETRDGEKRTTKVEYYTRLTEMIFNVEECKLCQQCVRVCPKDALSMPTFPKGVRLPRSERVPIFQNPIKCKFCGVCMILCPYQAISMKLNGNTLTTADLDLTKAGVLPEISEVKIRSIELKDASFRNDFWDKIISKMSPKKSAQT